MVKAYGLNPYALFLSKKESPKTKIEYSFILIIFQILEAEEKKRRIDVIYAKILSARLLV